MSTESVVQGHDFGRGCDVRTIFHETHSELVELKKEIGQV